MAIYKNIFSLILLWLYLYSSEELDGTLRMSDLLTLRTLGWGWASCKTVGSLSAWSWQLFCRGAIPNTGKAYMWSPCVSYSSIASWAVGNWVGTTSASTLLHWKLECRRFAGLPTPKNYIWTFCVINWAVAWFKSYLNFSDGKLLNRRECVQTFEHLYSFFIVITTLSIEVKLNFAHIFSPLPLCLYVRLSVHLSVSQSVCLSVCLSLSTALCFSVTPFP